jgi:hypothetical protein
VSLTAPAPTTGSVPVSINGPTHPEHHSGPHTPPSGPESADAGRRSWAVLALALTAQILVVLDISVVNTALPTIGRSLRLGSSDLQWLVTIVAVVAFMRMPSTRMAGGAQMHMH